HAACSKSRNAAGSKGRSLMGAKLRGRATALKEGRSVASRGHLTRFFLSPTPPTRIFAMTSVASPPTLERIKPAITAAEAAAALGRLYGIEAAAEEIDGELDRNFAMICGDERQFVLKVYHAAAAADVLDFQNRALAHAADRDHELRVPRVLADREGRKTSTLTLGDGSTRFVRVLEWIPGTPMSAHGPHDPTLLSSLGTYLGRLDRALGGFQHQAMRRPILWAISRATEHRAFAADIAD